MKQAKLNYNQIDNYIYVGTNMCCTIALDPELIKKGISADISLEEKKVDAPLGVDYYIWLPTKDHYAPSLEKMLFGVLSLDYFVQNKIKTFVHCKEGHTRAPTLVAAYLIYSRKLTTEQAIKLIKKKRPVTHISPQQLSALHEFEKYLQKNCK